MSAVPSLTPFVPQTPDTTRGGINTETLREVQENAARITANHQQVVAYDTEETSTARYYSAMAAKENRAAHRDLAFYGAAGFAVTILAGLFFRVSR